MVLGHGLRLKNIEMRPQSITRFYRMIITFGLTFVLKKCPQPVGPVGGF